MKIKDFVDKAKNYIFLGGLLIAITSGVILYADLPKQITQIKADHQETEKTVSTLESTMTEYMAVQKVVQESAEKREQMIFELIKEIRKE
uniref:Uncharacterized protein n=1 Tax=viral metagenome TaxID=1070528 RepID=A0A6M3KPF6_9ZZZZ